MAPRPPIDMLRDEGIRQMGAKAIEDGAVTAMLVYETAAGRIIVRSVPAARSAMHGLVAAACDALERPTKD